jgi:hypothetical protein
MTRDIDHIIEGVKRRLPSARFYQHRVKHPSVDDDGIWWFYLPGIDKDIQIESSDGMCPFMVEHDDMGSACEAETARSIEEAVEKVVTYLTCLKDKM